MVGVDSEGTAHRSAPVWAPPPAGKSLFCLGNWLLTDGDGTEALDSSLYGQHGSIVTGKSDLNWVMRTGNSRGGIRLDGIDDYIRIPGGRFPPGAFTVSALICTDSPARDNKPGAMGIYSAAALLAQEVRSSTASWARSRSIPAPSQQMSSTASETATSPNRLSQRRRSQARHENAQTENRLTESGERGTGNDDAENRNGNAPKRSTPLN